MRAKSTEKIAHNNILGPGPGAVKHFVVNYASCKAAAQNGLSLK